MSDETAERPPDCGDSACVCAESRRGMRTNGGCRCEKPQLRAAVAHYRGRLDKVAGEWFVLLNAAKSVAIVARTARDAAVSDFATTDAFKQLEEAIAEAEGRKP